jgi:hypothetical protein
MHVCVCVCVCARACAHAHACMCVLACVHACVHNSGEIEPAVHGTKICGPKTTANWKSCKYCAASYHANLSQQSMGVSCQIK